MAVRLFGERFHMIQIRRPGLLSLLDVAIAWLRSRRFHAHGHQTVPSGHELQTFPDVTVEGLIAIYSLVRRGNHHLRLGTHTLDAKRRPCHTWRSVALYGFH